jgi:hypothetical protein
MIRALMKKVLVVCLLMFACRKEVPEVARPVPVAKNPSPRAPLPVARGEGDYSKAVDWVRNAPGFRFDVTIGDVSASGELARARVGEERVRFKVKGEEWAAERHLKGVTWSRNGKPDTNEPPYADRIYQWMTLFPDPRKSPLQIVGTEDGSTHIRFTNLNTNETHDVWVRNADNHLMRLKTSGAGSAFPAVEIEIK